jgi:hypothetical protein
VLGGGFHAAFSQVVFHGPTMSGAREVLMNPA